MGDYKKMYYIMIDASERAIEEMTRQNYGRAKEILILAEQQAEELYVSSGDGESESDVTT